MTVYNPLQPFSVFIVDDSSIVAERLTMMIHELKHVQIAGYASNIKNALLLILETKPQVVILDINLKEDAPNANGIDLLIPLRKAFSTILIIMLTNIVTAQYRSRCMELGADYFFDKSNDFDKIPETLLNYMQTGK